MKKRLLARYLDWRDTWKDYPHNDVMFGVLAACAVICFWMYLMAGLDAPLPPLDSVTQVEVASTDYADGKIYTDEFDITKCYAHLNFNSQYKLWFPKEEDRPLTIRITHGKGDVFDLHLGETTLSFNGKTFPLKQGEAGECLNSLTEHLLLK